MSDLSPAAQSVINAAVEAGGGYGRATPVLHARIAAALRAVADELASSLFVGPDEGDIKRVIDVSDLHDLVDELEAQ
jgi:DNA topoisomerase IB